MKLLKRFLAIHDPNAAPGVPPPQPGAVPVLPLLAVTPAPAPAQPQPVITPEQVAQAAAQAAQNAIAQHEAAKIADKAARKAANEKAAADAELAKTAEGRLALLQRQVDEHAAALRQQQLENVRLNVINAARGEGRLFLEGMVGGATEQQIANSIAIAEAEYRTVEQDVLRRYNVNPQAVPVGAQPPQYALPPSQWQPQGAQPQYAPPMGYGGQVAPPQISAPQYLQPAGAPAPQQGLTPEQVAHLTSPASVRNGDYARYRHLLQSSLSAAGTPGRNWSLQPQQPIAQPMPQQYMPQQQHAYGPPPQPPPAPYAAGPMGAQVPQVQPMYARQAFNAPPPAYAPPAQPEQLDAAAGQLGYVPQFDVNAARASAQAAVSAARARTPLNSQFHGNVQ